MLTTLQHNDAQEENAFQAATMAITFVELCFLCLYFFLISGNKSLKVAPGEACAPGLANCCL